MHDIKPGDYFEDCGFSPALCFESSEDGIVGIRLIDGKPTSCSWNGCGPRKLTLMQALRLRFMGPDERYIEAIQSPPLATWEPESRWWELADYSEIIKSLKLEAVELPGI